MKNLLFTIFGIIFSSTPLLAENEVTYDPSNGVVTIPQVIILGDNNNSRYKVKLNTNSNGIFTIAQVDQTSAKIDTEVEKYIVFDPKTSGRLVYGQSLRRNYDKGFDSSSNNSLPYYATEYAQGMEVRVYKNENDISPVAKSLTDRNGFYQIIVSPGSYKICFDVNTEYCGTFVLGELLSQRCNFNDLGGGNKPSVTCAGN